MHNHWSRRSVKLLWSSELLLKVFVLYTCTIHVHVYICIPVSEFIVHIISWNTSIVLCISYIYQYILFYINHVYSSLDFSGKVLYIHPLIVYCDFVNLFTFSKSSGGFLLSFCTVSYYISSPNCSIRIKKRTGTCNSEICTASGIFMNANISIMLWIYAVFTEK